MAELAGGSEALAMRMDEALDNGDYQWALQLADHVARLDGFSSSARATKRKGLLALAERQINATARNYYISCAKELDDDQNSATSA